jgi:lipopolysaccharide export system protein LptC
MPRPAVRAARQTGRTDGDRVFQAASRHSRFVRFLRVAIPLGIAAATAAVVITAFFNPFRLIAAFPIDPGRISVSGTKIVMELPRMSGYTRDARPYELTARAAAQDITKPDVLELSDVSAHVELENGKRMNLTSVNGLYDTKGEILKLSDHIVLISADSYEAYLSEATVNVTTGVVVSESPVKVKLTKGWLDSKRLEVLEHGDLLRFGGGVEMTLNPDPPQPAQPPPPPQSARPQQPQAPVATGSVARGVAHR